MRRSCGLKNNVNPHRKDKENVYYIEYGFSIADKVLSHLYNDATYYLHRKKMVFDHIRTSDSDTLGEKYNTIYGRYNTHGVTQSE